MEWFVFILRLICHICKRLRLCSKDVHIYSPAFLLNLLTPFLVRRYYKSPLHAVALTGLPQGRDKSLWVYVDVLHISHNPSRRVCPLRRIAASDSSRQAGVSSANHGCFLKSLGPGWSAGKEV